MNLEPQHAEEKVPLGIRIAAAWSWRLLLIAAAAAVLIWLIIQVKVLVVPLMVAILLSALLQPIVTATQRAGLPRGVGVLFALISFLAMVAGLIWLIVTQFSGGLDGVAERATREWVHIAHWIDSLGLGTDLRHLHISFTDVLHTVRDNQSRIWSGAIGVASSAASFATGALLTLFTLIFLLLDGKRVWYWVLGFLPSRAHAPMDAAAAAGWVSVGQYVRVQVLVAFVDAVGVALGAFFLGVPLVMPIGIMVFLGSFIPFLGAVTTGFIACLIALVYQGPVAALILLAVVIVVNQLEGHILQPLVMGSAVNVHPLGVVFAVSAGAILAGIPGALFAVPIAAAGNAIVNTLVHSDWRSLPDPVAAYHRRNESRRKARARLKNIAKLEKQKGA